MKEHLTTCAAAVVAAVASLAPLGASAADLDRTVLPIQLPKRPVYKELDVRDVKTPPKHIQITAPKGAPNVIIVLIDDLGFGGTSTFGGPIPTPTFDKLAQGGLRYTNFHTTALCSPTRAALKSGRNHHMVNMGFITEMATGFPGATGEIPDATAPVAEILRRNGYSTAAFGKWHETAVWETSVSGPYFRWPTSQGFDKFYGFIGGETNQWAPFLYDGVTQVDLPDDPNYHFMIDMTDKAIAWVKYQKAITPEKPFFVYFAPGATHAPHHVPADWIAKWKGKFDQGWDEVRKETLARQIQQGIVPKNTKLAPKPAAIKDWATLSADEKKLFAHQAEVFAAFLDFTDHQVGRLLQAVKDTGEADNTLVFFIAGDNGTSGEGGENGMFNEYTYFNGVRESVPEMLKVMDKWGDPYTYPHMAAGWAVGFDAPFGWMKQVASDFGGTRNGMVVYWPKGMKARNEIRTQFGHVIDVAPTILEAAKLPEPKIVDGTPQIPMQGTSLVYTFDDAKAKERHTTQYFEISGNRAIYHDGWFARTIHRPPWELQPKTRFKDDVWELYDVRNDFSLSTDVAKRNPQKLAELQALFMREAEKNHVLPLDDRMLERGDPKLVDRPSLMSDRTSLTLAEGMTGLMENDFLNLKNKSFTVTADLDVPAGGGNGAVIAQGGRFGGWAVYVNQGKPGFDYNFLGLMRFSVVSPKVLAAGKSTVQLDFKYDGGGMGKGGMATLSVNGEQVAQGRVEHTEAIFFSADETCDVGVDLGTPVVEAIGSEARSRFTGRIPKVTIELRDVSAKADADVARGQRLAKQHME